MATTEEGNFAALKYLQHQSKKHDEKIADLERRLLHMSNTLVVSQQRIEAAELRLDQASKAYMELKKKVETNDQI